jgi:hypothetical protein
MNIPFSLYDYLALFVPGILIMLGLTPALTITSADVRAAGALEFVILAAVALVIGHFNQWLTKALLVAIGQFCPSFGNVGAFLLRHPYPNPPPKNPPSLGKRLGGAVKSLFPFWWTMQRLSKERAARIQALLDKHYGYVVRPEEAIGKILSALEAAGQKDVIAKREQLHAQADFLRGTAVALIIMGFCVWRWGLPQVISPQRIFGATRLYLAITLWVMSGTFVKRHRQYEFNMANLLFGAFEGLVRSAGAGRAGADQVAAAKQ